MTRAALVFTVTSFLPVPLIVAGALWGGVWVWLALFYLTVFAFSMDELIARAGGESRGESEFLAHNVLAVALALAHFAVLGIVVFALSRGDGAGIAQSTGLFLAAGLFIGQIGNANAHELIHRSRRSLFTLGKWVYISVLFGHHTSAHRHVHHQFCASDDDPNSARLGEGYYRFAWRAWTGSFRAGYRAENRRRAKAAVAPVQPAHPYVIYCLGAVGVLATAALIGGLTGVAVLVGLAGFAQSQLLLSDYVQHYGLRRKILPDGRLEPVGPRHSWNAPHWYTGHMMLNAPRHSDHHAHPARPYPALRMHAPDVAPTLPRSLPAMALLALYPRKWKQVMNPRVAAWQADRAPLGSAA